MRIILSNGGLMVFFSMVQKDVKKSPTKKKARFFRWCFSDGVTFFWGKKPKSKEDELRLKLSEPEKKHDLRRCRKSEASFSTWYPKQAKTVDGCFEIRDSFFYCLDGSKTLVNYIMGFPNINWWAETDFWTIDIRMVLWLASKQLDDTKPWEKTVGKAAKLFV